MQYSCDKEIPFFLILLIVLSVILLWLCENFNYTCCLVLPIDIYLVFFPPYIHSKIVEFDFRRKRYQIVKSESEFSVKLIKSSIISDLSLDMQFLKGFLLLTSYRLIICMQIHTVVKLFNPLNLFFPHSVTVQLNCQIMKHQFIINFYFFILDISALFVVY